MQWSEVTDKDKIYQVYTKVIQKRNPYSNCYFSPKQMIEWINKDYISFYVSEEDNFFIILPKCGYKKLLFNASNFDWVDGLKQIKTNDENIVVEIVSKEELNPYGLKEILPYSRIKQYARYRRLNVYELTSEYPEIQYCELEDIPAISLMFQSTFEAIGDDLPSIEEIKMFITDKSIICIKEEGKLEGYIMFQNKGKTSYIRNICVSEDARGKGIGSKLLDMYLRLHRDFISFTLWCRKDNIPAIKLYEKYGYVNENMHNTLYIC